MFLLLIIYFIKLAQYTTMSEINLGLFFRGVKI